MFLAAVADGKKRPAGEGGRRPFPREGEDFWGYILPHQRFLKEKRMKGEERGEENRRGILVHLSKLRL